MRVIRKELIKNPEKFGIDLGARPASLLKSYENNKLIPKPITIGGNGPRDPWTGYYYPAFIEILKDIKIYKKKYKYLGIREILEKKYRRVFELTDIVDLFRLRLLTEPLLKLYLEGSSLSSGQKEIIMRLFHKEVSHKEVKNTILKMLTNIKTRNELYE